MGRRSSDPGAAQARTETRSRRPHVRALPPAGRSAEPSALCAARAPLCPLAAPLFAPLLTQNPRKNGSKPGLRAPTAQAPGDPLRACRLSQLPSGALVFRGRRCHLWHLSLGDLGPTCGSSLSGTLALSALPAPSPHSKKTINALGIYKMLICFIHRLYVP